MNTKERTTRGDDSQQGAETLITVLVGQQNRNALVNLPFTPYRLCIGVGGAEGLLLVLIAIPQQFLLARKFFLKGLERT